MKRRSNYAALVHGVFAEHRKRIARGVIVSQARQFSGIGLKLPQVSEAVKTSRVVRSTKGAEEAVGTLRDAVHQALIDAVQKHGISTTGRAVPASAAVTFRESLKEVFENYTGETPSNVEAMAVTETRGIANQIRQEYAQNVSRMNPGTAVYKTWHHTTALKRHDARANHLAMHGMQVEVDRPFKLRTDSGVIMCMAPHADELPIGEKINCRCEARYSLRKKE